MRVMATTDNPEPEGADASEKGAQNKAQRRIAGASGFLMVGVLLSRLLGLVRERVISTHFGQGIETDIYTAAFNVPDIIFFLIAGGGLSTAIIPTFTQYINEGRKKEAWQIFKVVALFTTMAVGGLILLGEIFAPMLVRHTNPGFTPEEVSRCVSLTRILLPAQICFFLGGLMMGILQTRNNMKGQVLGPLIYNLGIIFGGLVLTHFMPKGSEIAGLCWGAVGGAVLGNLALQWFMIRRSGGHWSEVPLRTLLREPGVKEGALQVWYMMLPIILSVALPQVSALMNRYYASYLEQGTMSALNRANQLMQVPLGVFGQAVSIAILPTLAAQFVKKDMNAIRRTTNFGLRFILFLTIPCSVLMIVLAVPIVQLALQGGRYHTADSVTAATALSYYSIGIMAWSAQALISRAFYSMKDTKTPMIVGTVVTFLIFIPLNPLLLSRLGYRGLALATSVSATINMFTLFFLLRRRLKGIEGGRLLASVLKIGVASAVMGGVCHWLYLKTSNYRDVLEAQKAAAESVTDFHTAHALPHAFQALLLCSAVGLAIYLAFALLLRMDEISPLRKILRRFVPRRA
jgi:putative peptidoglycan lipid II flippase